MYCRSAHRWTTSRKLAENVFAVGAIIQKCSKDEVTISLELYERCPSWGEGDAEEGEVSALGCPREPNDLKAVGTRAPTGTTVL